VGALISYRLAGSSYRPVVLHLHRRFFYHERKTAHSHPEYHFILVSQGKCELLQPQLPPVPCPLNSLIMINPNYPHTFHTDSDGVEHSCLIFSLQDDNGTKACSELGQLLDPDMPKESLRITHLNEVSAAALLRSLTTAMRLRKQDSNSIAADIALNELIIRCLRLSFPSFFAPSYSLGRKEQLTAQARSFIEQHIADPELSVAMLAKQLGFHPNHLNKVFREIEQIPIGEYIITRRIQRACQMLSAGQRGKDVANHCGFASQNYFCRLFRQRVGVSPSQFQEQDTTWE
jgi:AraC-like DNA-binding protein